jgi:hypothetical protein
MPDRKDFELILVMFILLLPAAGLVHLWAVKNLVKAPEGSFKHKVAQVVGVVTA